MAKAIDYDLETDFPSLDSEGFEKTSDANRGYNCIAWSNHDNVINWWPQFGPPGINYWPSGLPFNDSLDTFHALYRLSGYEVCASADAEVGLEKVAIYAKGLNVTHAARQLECGRWSSKIGQNIDLTHNTLKALEGPCYGLFVSAMARPRTSKL